MKKPMKLLLFYLPALAFIGLSILGLVLQRFQLGVIITAIIMLVGSISMIASGSIK